MEGFTPRNAAEIPPIGTVRIGQVKTTAVPGSIDSHLSLDSATKPQAVESVRT